MLKDLNKADFAQLANVSPRTVTRWIAEGLPAEGEGKKGKELRIPIHAGAMWWHEFLNRQQFGDEGPKNNHESEKIRLTRARAEKLEAEYKKIAEKLLPVEDVQDFLNDISVIYGTQLDALGGRLADELSGISDPAQIRERLFTECRSVRIATAEKLNKYADSIGETSRGDSQRATDSDG